MAVLEIVFHFLPSCKMHRLVGCKMKIVSEIGLAHSGCLGTALAYVDACAKAGVDACKFQTHFADKTDRFRPGTYFPQDVDRQSYWQRTGFDIEQWKLVRGRCHANGVEFGLSVFAPEAVKWLRNGGCEPDFWKLGSGVSMNRALAESLRRGVKPTKVAMSFGMSSWQEIEAATKDSQIQVGSSAGCGLDLTLLSCTSEYPCPPEHVGIRNMRKLERYCLSVGLSDHSGTIYPSLVAAWLGADMCEVHVTWSRECFGPDVPASITIDELRQLVQGVRFIERMRDNPVDKDKMASELSQMREIFCAK